MQEQIRAKYSTNPLAQAAELHGSYEPRVEIILIGDQYQLAGTVDTGGTAPQPTAPYWSGTLREAAISAENETQGTLRPSDMNRFFACVLQGDVQTAVLHVDQMYITPADLICLINEFEFDHADEESADLFLQYLDEMHDLVVTPKQYSQFLQQADDTLDRLWKSLGIVDIGEEQSAAAQESIDGIPQQPVVQPQAKLMQVPASSDKKVNGIANQRSNLTSILQVGAMPNPEPNVGSLFVDGKKEVYEGQFTFGRQTAYSDIIYTYHKRMNRPSTPQGRKNAIRKILEDCPELARKGNLYFTSLSKGYTDKFETFMKQRRNIFATDSEVATAMRLSEDYKGYMKLLIKQGLKMEEGDT